MTGVDLKVSVKHKLQLLMIYDTARPPSESFINMNIVKTKSIYNRNTFH